MIEEKNLLFWLLLILCIVTINWIIVIFATLLFSFILNKSSMKANEATKYQA